MTIAAASGSWIDVCRDGKEILRRYLPEQSKVNTYFFDEAVVRLGSSGGVRISIDGIGARPLGHIGQPRVVQFDMKGFHFLTPGEPGYECGSK
jgi:hypothetical protein